MKSSIELLKEILMKAKEKKASDIHFIKGMCPSIRINGEIEQLHEFEVLTSNIIKEMMNPYLEPHDWEELELEKELDFAFYIEGFNRYRANLHMEMGNLSLALRVLIEIIPDLKDLKLPKVVETFINYKKGLILVTGSAGSGKSTTLAALIEEVNKTRSENIITIEDPVEFLYEKKKSLIRQREVGRDTPSFARGLKGALRQDPNIILVGELRDLESIEAALTAAETGHLIFGTLHTNGAVETINRLVDVFPESRHQQIRIQLASSLKAVLSQELIKCKSGGRVVATEIMILNKAISNLIINGKSNQILSAIETGGKQGMIRMEASLREYLENGIITQEEYDKRVNDNEIWE